MSQIKMYRVTRKSFIDGRLLNAGEDIQYSGEHGDNLQPLDSDGNPIIATAAVQDGDGADLETLRQQYEELFNEKPHFNTGAAKLQAAIDEKRKELGAN